MKLEVVHGKFVGTNDRRVSVTVEDNAGNVARVWLRADDARKFADDLMTEVQAITPRPARPPGMLRTSELKPGMTVRDGSNQPAKTVAFTEIKPCSYYIRFTDDSSQCGPRDYPFWQLAEMEVNDDRNSESGVDKQSADHR